MRSLSFIIFIAVMLLSGCGGDKPPSESETQEQNQGQNENGDGASSENQPIAEISLAGQSGDVAAISQLIDGQPVDPSAVVSASFANALGNLRQASVGEGNLSFGVSAQDPDGLTEISLFIPSLSRNFVLCSADCGTDFYVMLTGINPELFGANAGPIRFELFLRDTLDNLVGVDALNVNWQPIQIFSLNASRENGFVTVNWGGSSTLARYNLYAATEFNLNKDQVFNLDNGLQQLAILGTSTAFVDADPAKDYHVVLTGIDSDGESGLSTILTVPRTAGLANQAPIANPDSYQIEEEQVLVANVIDNDLDNEGQVFSLSAIVVPPVNGTVTLDEANQAIYTPSLNFVGQDSFVYQITDSEGASSQASVEVNISAVNDNPVANNDSYVLNLDKTLTITSAELLANDTDVDGDTLSVSSSIVEMPAFGTLEANSDGSFTYRANDEFTVQDSFDYQIEDGHGGQSQARVFVLLNTSDQPPVAQNDAYQINEDTTLTVDNVAHGVLANDSDPNDRTFQLADLISELPQHGQLNLVVDGTFNYIPDSDFFGVDQFKYQIINSAGVTAQATVTIDVLAQNDMPITADDSYQINEDNSLNISAENGLLNNDFDPDLGLLTVNTSPISAPSQGNVILQADGSFVYTANNHFYGVDSFSYQVNNTSGEVNTAQVFITVLSVNDIPVALNDSFAVDEDNTLNASSVLSNDSDADGDTLAINTTPITDVSQGNLTLFADGTFTYVPAVNTNGIDTFTYEVTDGNGGSAQATVTLTVNAINDAPIAVNDSYNLNEDTPLNASTLLANDSDIEGDSLSVNPVPVTDVTNGSLTLGSDGSFSYTPSSGFFGNDSFSYQVLDGNGGSATASVNLTIISVNDIPVALNDSFAVDEDNTLNASSVLSNDSDADGDTLAINTTPITDVSQGNLTLFADGTFTYVPAVNTNGIDTFTYEVTDGNGGSAQATVTLTVNAINDAPIAVNDSYNLNEDTPLNASTLLANDSDIEGDSLSVNPVPVTDVTNGSLTLGSDGSFSYTPSSGFFGNDSFSYQVLDGNGGSATASVNLTIISVNDIPVALNDSFAVDEDNTLNASSVLSNDTDADGDTLAINTTPITDVSQGNLTLFADGTFTYVPAVNTNGIDTFTYEVTDGNGGSAQATVTLTVNAINDAPIAVNDSYNLNEDTPLNASTLLANDSDIEGDSLTVNPVPVTDVTNGSLTLGSDGSFSYTPSSGFFGNDSFSYQVLDGNGGSATASVNLTIISVNDIPVALNDSFAVDEDNTLNASSVLSNDSDADGDTLAINTTPITDVSQGNLTLFADGTFTYVPAVNTNGIDTFTYEVTDGNGGSAQATVTLTVNAINDAPIAVNDSYNLNEDTPLNASTLLANDSDIEGDSLSVNPVPVTDVTNGSLTLGSDGSFSYTPSSGFFGNDSFSYQVLDGNGGTATASVNLTIISVNDIPVALNDSFAVDEDIMLAGSSVLVNDTDADGDTLSVNTTVESNVSNGNLTLFANGTFSYLADGDFNGVDSFTYRVEDGQGGSATATVNITVNAINDAPIAVNDSYSLVEDASLNISAAAANRLLINDYDVDGDVVTLSTSPVTNVSHGSLTLNGDGSFNYTPSANYSGSDSFTYQIDDGNGTTANATVTLTVTNINDAPIANNDSFVMTEGFTLSSASVLTNDTDLDGDTLTINTTPIVAPSSGVLVLAADGTFSYTPITNGVFNFTYQVNDGNGLSDTGIVTITVNSNNIDPVGVDDNFVVVENHIFNGSSVLNNDTDADGNTLSVNTTPTVPTTNGSLTLNADGSFVYNPSADFVGSDSFTYELNDGNGGTSTAVVNLTINANAVPSAVNDSYQLDEDSVLNASSVLVNDTDAEGDTLTINTTAIADVNNGGLTINADGSFTYIPNTNFTGVDSFTYEVDDGKGDTAQAVVSITVNPLNDLPIAAADNFSIDEDTVLNGSSVLANDTDVDGDTLTVSTVAISSTTQGGLTLNSDGTFVYTPNANANGSDSFIYQVNDGQGGTDEATVNISITAINDIPVAVNDSYNMLEDTVLTINTGDADHLLANDSDPEGDSLMINTTPTSNVSNGSVTLGSDGSFTYTPNGDFFGVDNFSYQLEDGQGGVTTGSVSITVGNLNDIPVTVNDSYSIDEDLVLNGSSVLLNDSDIDGDSLSLITSTVSGPSNGIVVLNSNGSFVYTANANFFGSDSFVYQVSDGQGGSANGTVNITINNINDAPVAVVDNYTIAEDATLNATSVLVNDTDLDGDSLTVNTTPVVNVSQGSLTLENDGTFVYLPSTNFNGSDSFTYQISDGNGETSQAQVNITVDAVNDKPVVSDQSFSIAENKTDGDIVGTVTASDIEGDTLSFAIIGGDASLFNIGASSGQITVNGITPLNFENITQHGISVEITDDGSPSQNTVIGVTINVDNVLEPLVPTEVSSFGRPAASFFELTGEKIQAKLFDSHRDGNKIYFVGRQENIDQDIYMTAYNKDGVIDTGFGNNGEQVLDFGQHETVKAIAEKGGKYYLAFESFNGMNTEICFIKVDHYGELDTDLGINGVRCTEEQSDLSINDMVYNGTNFYAVGRKRTTDDDLLIIQLDDALTFIDHTPGDLTDTPHIITDISGNGSDDEGRAIFSPNGSDLLIAGNVESIAGDLDIFAWLLDENGVAISSFNTDGSPAIYDINGLDDVVSAIGGKAESNFTAYLAGHTVLANGRNEAMLMAINSSGNLSSGFTPSGIATYDVDGDGGSGSGDAEFTGIAWDSSFLYLGGSFTLDQRKVFATRIRTISVDDDVGERSGDVDNTYGNNGYRKITYANAEAYTLSMSFDGDNTSWLAGYRETGSDTKMVITAIDANGNSLVGDAAGDFLNGKHIIDYPSIPSDDYAVKVVKIANGADAGKYLVVSRANANSSNDVVFSRFTSAGVLDSSFDFDGHKQVKLGDDVDVLGLIELSSGDFIVYGNIDIAGATQGVIAKLDADNNIDTSFANNGIYTTEALPASNLILAEAKVDNLGRIVAVGTLDGSAFIMRLTASGSLDLSFDSNGYNVGSAFNAYSSLVIDTTNNIFVGGERTVLSKVMLLVKYTNNGTLDNSFASLGSLQIDFSLSFEDYVEKVLLDNSNNLYLLGGNAAIPNQVVAVKVSADGTLDTSFSNDGKARFVMAPDNGNALVLDAALDSDNNIVIAGQAEVGAINSPMLGRIKADGTLDNLLNISGFFIATSCTNAAQFSSVLLLDDTTWVVAGHCYIDGTFKNNVDLTQYQLLEL